MIYFAWDDAKADSNLRKHGVRFEFATQVFDDPFALSINERVASGEERWQVYGLAGRMLLMVVYTITAIEDDEYIRIISARKAERKELKKYEKQKFH